MQRRDFLKQAGVAAAASSLATGPFIHAADKAGTQTPVIGKGEHQYECHHGWGTLPDSIKWETTHGVTVDKDGFVYIKHQGNAQTPVDTIVVFDPDGKYVRSFGKGIYPGGHGIDLRDEGGTQYLYLCDVAHRKVLKTDLKGAVVWTKGFPEESGVYKSEDGFRPTNVAFAPDGGFYVADGYGSNYIHQYDKAAKWVRTWGGTGDAPGQFKTPHGLWLDDRPGREPSLVVADRANARLQYFTLDGKPLSVVSEVLFPAHLDIRGDVLLVPDLHARVSLFDKDNKVIVHLGDDPAWLAEVKKFKIRGDASTWMPGKFVHPHDACFDRDGNIFVTEWVTTGRVSKLRKVS
ncbi:twin-arginine translocation signal domain-containing protein [Isosphaeraceae bacterium EP7]